MPQTAFNEEIRKYFMLMKHDIDKGWQVQSQCGKFFFRNFGKNNDHLLRGWVILWLCLW